MPPLTLTLTLTRCMPPLAARAVVVVMRELCGGGRKAAVVWGGRKAAVARLAAKGSIEVVVRRY